MDRIALFAVLQLMASLYAMARGGAPERIVGAALLAAAIATGLMQSAAGPVLAAIDWSGLAVDAALLLVLVAVALFSDRFWPLWVAALHALGTGAHMVRGMDHGIEPVAYAILLACWSYPIILFLVIGTHRHSRRRQALGHDLDWTPSLPARAG